MITLVLQRTVKNNKTGNPIVSTVTVKMSGKDRDEAVYDAEQRSPGWKVQSVKK